MTSTLPSSGSFAQGLNTSTKFKLSSPSWRNLKATPAQSESSKWSCSLNWRSTEDLTSDRCLEPASEVVARKLALESSLAAGNTVISTKRWTLGSESTLEELASNETSWREIGTDLYKITTIPGFSTVYLGLGDYKCTVGLAHILLKHWSSCFHGKLGLTREAEVVECIIENTKRKPVYYVPRAAGGDRYYYEIDGARGRGMYLVVVPSSVNGAKAIVVTAWIHGQEEDTHPSQYSGAVRLSGEDGNDVGDSERELEKRRDLDSSWQKLAGCSWRSRESSASSASSTTSGASFKNRSRFIEGPWRRSD